MASEQQPKNLSFRAHSRHFVTSMLLETNKIITASDDQSICIHDAATGHLIRKLEGHSGGVWSIDLLDNFLVSASTDKTARVWEIESGKCISVLRGHTSTVRQVKIVAPEQNGKSEAGELVLMPPEPLVITASRDSTMRIWKLPQLEQLETIDEGTGEDEQNPYFQRVLTGHNHTVRSMDARGDVIVSGSYDTTVRVWRTSTGEQLHNLAGHSQKIYAVVLDYENQRCFSGSMDSLIKIWSIESGQCLFTLVGHTSLVGLLALNDGYLVSGAADSTMRVWDPETGECKSTLAGHTGAVTCFQHDGSKVVSGSDKNVKLWDIKSGEDKGNLLDDLSGVWQVNFDDNRCVAAVQKRGETYIEVVDLRTGTRETK